MMMIGCTLALLLAAAPPAALRTAIVSPEPPAPFVRIQPRRVTASSWLKNGWNQYEQNYLPPYAADDDPATAWVEGAEGLGEGEYLDWFGPFLDAPRPARLYVRAGYQKSSKLYLANARPSRVRVQPLQRLSEGFGPVVSLPPFEADLDDATGWQELALTLPAGSEGVRLTIVSARPGTAYNDTCISDVRVYLDAGPKYRPEVEAALAEQIRRFVAERQAAAKDGAARPHVVLAPVYAPVGRAVRLALPVEEGEKGSLTSVFQTITGRASELSADDKSLIQKATQLLAAFEAIPQHEIGAVPEGWQRARLTPLVGARTAAVALHRITTRDPVVPDPLATLVPYLHVSDFAAFEDAGTSQRTARQVLDAMEREPALRFDMSSESVPLSPQRVAACRSACRKLLAPAWQVVQAAMKEAGEESSLADACEGRCDPEVLDFNDRTGRWLEVVAESGSAVQGPLGAPTALLREVSEVVGDRDPHRARHRDLIAYENGLATGALTVIDTPYASPRPQAVMIHVLSWRRPDAAAPPELARVTVYAFYLALPVSLEMWTYEAKTS